MLPPFQQLVCQMLVAHMYKQLLSVEGLLSRDVEPRCAPVQEVLTTQLEYAGITSLRLNFSL